MTISIIETYNQRNILLLGGLGFLGKVLLTTLLAKIPNINKITLIIRPTSLETAEERFTFALKNSPVFAPLRSQWQDQFEFMIRSKVQCVSGDASRPSLGIEDKKILFQLQDETDLVINSAGLVSFNPTPQLAVDANINGAIYAAKFVKASKHASLLHISTCFVAGNGKEMIAENIPTTAPNGTPLDLSNELEVIQNSFLRKDLPPKLSIAEAIAHANHLGWPNIYTYTKALGEFAVQAHLPPTKFAIIRPSIVESAISFPFPGWNEGYNTCAPILAIAQGWYPFVISAPEHIIDIIPVDICCLQTVKVGALLMQNRHDLVYQCSTSTQNPLFIKQLMQSTRKAQREVARRENHSLISKLRLAMNIRALSPNHPLSSMKLHAFFSKLPAKWLHHFRPLYKFARNLQKINDAYTAFLPFLYDNNYLFNSEQISKINALEQEFNPSIKAINWEHYWPNIQMPGVEKWCFGKTN
jgi:nucleoside-diphosphate-sugar epimerase